MKNPALIRLAAHIAHKLNTIDPNDPDGLVRLRPFRFWLELQRTLVWNEAHRVYVIGAPLLGLSNDKVGWEQAAMAWMDAVLDRPLALKAGHARHHGHHLLAALLARCPAADSALAAADGPVRLESPDGPVTAPPDLSLWRAIERGPRAMRTLEGRALDAFVHQMIQALETAHAGWGRMVALGLSPQAFDVSINQVKSLQAFVTCARAADRTDWPTIWAERSVTGFKSLEDFLSSDLGQAALTPAPPPLVVSFDEEIDTSPEEEPYAPEDGHKTLDALGEAESGFAALDFRIAREILNGASPADLWDEGWPKKHFATFDAFNTYIEILAVKIYETINQHIDDA